jgi:hypothetical protein
MENPPPSPGCVRLSLQRKKIKQTQRKTMKRQDSRTQDSAPAVIGGVGGSGTRLIAQCLKEAGFHIGTDLNKANDNLWFTLLFKRIEILSASEEEFDELLRIFIKGMTGSTTFSRHQVSLIESLSSKDREQHPSLWLKKRAETLLSQTAAMNPDERWGWKEPNSHIVLDRLFDRVENMKYIHVTRNGLDMAYSKNQNQLRLWGSHFINGTVDETPHYSLKYWCIIHERVLHIGKSMGENFLFLNYDEFCMNPEIGLKKLFRFLGIDIESLLPKLVALVSPPDSIGRFKKHSTEIFSAKDIAFVKSLGFDVGSR